MTVDTEEALNRNAMRYTRALIAFQNGESNTPPRKPSEAIVRNTHRDVSDISILVADKFDEFELWDSNVPIGSERIKIATCTKGGKLTAVPGQEERLQAYLDKGRSGAKVVDGIVVIE